MFDHFTTVWQKHSRVFTFLALGLIILFGAWLRLFDYSELTRFNNDQVRDIMLVEAMHEGVWPSLGPKAGGTEFKLGPGFYYLEYLSSLLFGLNPVGSTLLIPLLSLAALGLFFILLRKVTSLPIALSLTLLTTSSFYLIKYARFGWNPNFIPFFLLGFLFILIKILRPETRQLPLWYALAGLCMGIGMQLHTLMFMSLPLLFLITIILVWKRQQFLPLKGICITGGLVLLLFLPVLHFELTHQWSNTRAFFSGTEKKALASESFFDNTLETLHIFGQGSVYTLTGFEPEKNWLRPWKLFMSGEVSEITLFLLGASLILFGNYCLFRTIRNTPSGEKRDALILLSSLGVIILTAFLIIGNELNIRFFIILFPLPFLLLGLIYEHLIKWQRMVGFFVLTLTTLIFTGGNLKSVAQVYDFEHPRSYTGAYGGISLGESKLIAQAMIGDTEEATLFIAPFVFDRSVEYFVQKAGKKLITIKDTAPEKKPRFLILFRDAKPSALDQYQATFTIEHKTTIGRFNIFWLETKSLPGQ